MRRRCRRTVFSFCYSPTGWVTRPGQETVKHNQGRAATPYRRIAIDYLHLGHEAVKAAGRPASRCATAIAACRRLTDWLLRCSTTSMPKTERTTVELRDYWQTIRRRWRVVLAALAVAVSAALPAHDSGDTAVLLVGDGLRLGHGRQRPGSALLGQPVRHATSDVHRRLRQDPQISPRSSPPTWAATWRPRRCEARSRLPSRPTPPTSCSPRPTPIACSPATSRRATPRR